jgi:peptidoglycan hydrolase FlgJ
MDPTSASASPPTATPGAAGAQGSASTGAATAAHQTGENFEAFFLSQVFDNMFSGVNSDPLFGGGNGESVYRSLLLQEYSKVAARSGGIGIADAVQREILRAQEGQ